MKTSNFIVCMLMAFICSCTGRNTKKTEEADQLLLYRPTDSDPKLQRVLHASHASHYSAHITFEHSVSMKSEKALGLDENIRDTLSKIIGKHYSVENIESTCSITSISKGCLNSIDSITVNQPCYHLSFRIDRNKRIDNNTIVHSFQTYEYYILQDRSHYFIYDVLLDRKSSMRQIKNEAWVINLLDVIENGI